MKRRTTADNNQEKGHCANFKKMLGKHKCSIWLVILKPIIVRGSIMRCKRLHISVGNAKNASITLLRLASKGLRAYYFNLMSHWKVIHLKPNTEKKFSRYCKLYEIPCYIPMRKSTRIYQRRKYDIELPVFTGYAFARFSTNERLDILRSNFIVKVIEPYNPRQFLRELIMVRRALRVDPTLKPVDYLEEGQLVRITSGPFMGTEGIVKRVVKTTQVVLNISIIGQAIKVLIDQDVIEKL